MHQDMDPYLPADLVMGVFPKIQLQKKLYFLFVKKMYKITLLKMQ